MSVLGDEVAQAREKLVEVRRELADRRAQLGGLPAWLRVGDPARLTDPALRAQAENAANLVGEINSLEDEAAELFGTLDDLDGRPSPGWSPGAQDPDARVGVLLPVRLETRFTRPEPGAVSGDPGACWRLRVRVEPDAVVVASRAAKVVRREADLVAACWTRCAGHLDTEAGEAAFRTLCGQVGPARAAYLLRTVPVVPSGSGFASRGSYPKRGTASAPLLGLPRTLEIWGQDASGMRLLLSLTPDPDAIAAQTRLEAVLPQVVPGKPPPRPGTKAAATRLTWWNSYAEAANVGLAGQVDLEEDEPHFDVLMCLGVDRPGEGVEPAELFAAHADAGRLGTLAPLTATNTVAGSETTDLGRDPGPWLAGLREGPSTVGGLAGVLTGRPTLSGVPDPDLTASEGATALVRALWPVLWQRSLKDVAGLGSGVFRLGDWAGRHLQPFGPFPTLRVGDLPYGVLPVADFNRWLWRDADPATGASDPLVEQPMAAVLDHLLRPLAKAGAARGTSAGADTQRLLEVLGNVPVTREYGSRNLLPTVILAALLTALGAEAAADGPEGVLRAWDEQADYLRRILPEGPLRRYSPVASVEPWPERVAKDSREVLKRYLEASWVGLAEPGDLSDAWNVDDQHPPVVARLVRHALLLTQAELVRALPDPQDTAYLLPLHDPDQMYADASGGQLQDTGAVLDVPPSVAAAAGAGQLDQRATAALRQFEDVRSAVIDGMLRIEPEMMGAVLPAVLDTAGHRLDAWFTALATRRLRQLTRQQVPPVIGAYGWVDDLAPNPDPTPPTTAGLLHAPGYSQALASAVLRDHAVHEPTDQRWQIAVHSARIRLAASLSEQVRSGVHLSEALGREIERRVGEPGRVLDLRSAFPARPEWAGRRVCDGQQVLDATGDSPHPDLAAKAPAWLGEIGPDLTELRDTLDTYADLLVADALHDVVDGRPTSAAEALEAAAGLGAPPELRLLRTQREGGTVRTTVKVALPWNPGSVPAKPGPSISPARVADPAVADLLEAELGDASTWDWTSSQSSDPGVTLLQLFGFTVEDLLIVPESELMCLVGERLGAPPDGGTGSAKLARARRIVAALGGSVVEPGNRAHLAGRLKQLRAMATALVSALGAGKAGSLNAARRWALPLDGSSAAIAAATPDAMAAADALASRLVEIGPAAGDAAVGSDEIARRIRTLLPPAMALPLVCPAVLPELHVETKLDNDWLPVVSAVRPAVAAVEAAQLSAKRAWRSAHSGPASIWAPPPLSEHGVAGDHAVTVVYGPGLGNHPAAAGGSTVALSTVDSWAETVPAGRHTSWASFGYDAPRARAPQAVLLVVPPDATRPLSEDDVRGAVLFARSLARARAVTPPTPAEVSLGLPTGIVLATSPTACVLTEEPK